jgi:uncharacterized metal-binding protein YceD (DUF177 family)
MTDSSPLQRLFKLGELTQAGSDVTITATPEQLPGIAEWGLVDKVSRFEAKLQLKRLSTTRFSYAADLVADIVQACVVTLEPVESHLVRHIERELHLAPKVPEEVAELTLAAGDDDAPETITSLHYDLAGPLLEEFLLAIDPYPRKPGAAFAPLPNAESAPEKPFAALKALRDRE